MTDTQSPSENKNSTKNSTKLTTKTGRPLRVFSAEHLEKLKFARERAMEVHLHNTKLRKLWVIFHGAGLVIIIIYI